MYVDAHVHFWNPETLRYPWLAGTALDRAYRPADLAAELGELPGLVMVQADCAPGQARAEVEWVRAAAEAYPRILGMVAYAPLEIGPGADGLIDEYATDPFVVGVRRNIQDEGPGFAATGHFRYGVRALGEAGLTFDACVRHHQLGELLTLARACPGTTIVLDHLGKPPVATGEGRRAWRDALAGLAGLPHVRCKLSGLVTEAAYDTWTPDQVRPYLETALELFGPGRCLFGSDWPVLTLASDYRQWYGMVRALIPPVDRDAVLSGNAREIYGLPPIP
ncbi:amidohydrolase family protein [Catenuloplanes atrovinosus]|uniref:L-fuconolactonase n=1 Tax=Catenuloplanes atrovinosus TaxID=137266 RepID=A0AAE3YPV2_9ACTN|nr:amidohydrolase family protein [Catenuloplanes atrovinosus]MDR7276228.1 L-fuconolactonase [Catenuloplanes atrovinosus]